jgi:hypothetical protein
MSAPFPTLWLCVGFGVLVFTGLIVLLAVLDHNARKKKPGGRFEIQTPVPKAPPPPPDERS